MGKRTHKKKAGNAYKVTITPTSWRGLYRNKGAAKRKAMEHIKVKVRKVRSL